MSDINTLRERIAGVFSGALHLDVPSFDTDLFETGVLDSLAFVELLEQLEREFGVTTGVDDLEAENFQSISRIAAFIQSRAGVMPQGSTSIR
ncbi:MAG TPA: acyl carrier protein [Vicinamibacterales bacterium]|nr:acyl carrier protein [Vicinamibacterales bacterium]